MTNKHTRTLQDSWTIVPKASIGWRYLFEGDAVKAAPQSPTGSNFVSEGLPTAESSLTLGLGVETRLESGTTFGIVYQDNFADNASNHSAQGSLRVPF